MGQLDHAITDHECPPTMWAAGEVVQERPLRFALHLRVPGWCRRFTLAVDGKRVAVRARKGYVAVRRLWRTGDKLLLQLAMPVRLTRANPHVRQMAGRAAVERGPLVYCLEGTDHKHAELDDIALPLRARWTVVQRPQLLGGVAVLRTRGLAAKPWRGGLYAEAQAIAIATTFSVRDAYLRTSTTCS